MAVTHECDFCGKYLPRGDFACPHAEQPSGYQNVDDAADNEERAALEERYQHALADSAARERAAAPQTFLISANATERASARALQSGTAFVHKPDPQREGDPEQIATVQGDESAFWPLWQMHSSCLYQICLREMNGNREDAEDALAQAMMKALNKLYIFAPRIINPKAWLIRLTRNLCKDIHRTRARRRRIAGRLEHTAEKGQAAEAYNFWTAGHGDAFPCELEYDLESMIDALPVRLREVCVLRFTHELPYKEIATRLALTQANVRKRIQQARAMLRALRDNSISGNDPRWANCSLGETAPDVAAKCDTA